MKYKIIPTNKRELALCGYAIGIMTAISATLFHRIPETPELVQRVKQIDGELNGHPFSDLTLQELTEIPESERNIAEFFAQTVDHSKDLTKERAEIVESNDYKTQSRNHEENRSERARNLNIQGYGGLLLAIGSMIGYTISKKRADKEEIKRKINDSQRLRMGK